MEENFQMSHGYLNEIPYHDVTYLLVTCSHIFAAANIVGAGSRTQDDHSAPGIAGDSRPRAMF